MDEIEMDRGVTIDPRDLEVTDELIEKIRSGEIRKEILLDDSLSDREKFDKLKKYGVGLNSLSEVRRLKIQLR